jgi:hypothetical protein
VYCGADDVLASQLISWAVTLLTAGVLVGALWRLRGAVFGAVAGMLLLLTPLTIKHAAAQYADITLGLYMLSALALCVIAWESEHGASRIRMLFLAGLMASAAAWTKNEGIVFALVLTLAVCLKAAPKGPKSVARSFAALAAGMLPLGLCLVSQKLFYAGQTDLLEPRSIGQMIEQLVDPSRHQMILLTAWRLIRYMPPWVGIAIAAALILTYGLRLDRRARSIFLCLAGIVLTQVICYYVIYLTSAADLEWFLNTSAYRLAVQLWPSLIFLMCLLARTESRRRGTPQALAD